jgi:hypothetical protein
MQFLTLQQNNMRTFFIDPVDGNDANNGLSFANRKRTISSVSGSLTAGDNVRIIANTAPINIGSCTWNQYGTITLPAGETAGLYNDGAWASPGTGVTISAPSTTIRKEGVNSALLTVANTYTGTTKIASVSGLSATDLSAYSKINLWFQNSVGTTYANLSAFSLLLCSDSNGNVPVYSLPFPASIAPPVNTWVPIVIDNVAPFSLATNINSITLSANRQIHTASTGVYIDNVFASKNIRLDGLISKNSTTNVDVVKPEFWWSPRSVTGNVLSVEQSPSIQNYTATGGASRGYVGVTEVAAGYVLYPFIQAATSSSATGVLNNMSIRIGTEALPITIGGGWDRDTMTQQISGVTWMGTSHNIQIFISQNDSRNIAYNNLGINRCQNSIRIIGTNATATSGVTLKNVHVTGSRTQGIYMLTTSNSYILSCCSGIQCGFTTASDAPFSIANVLNLSAINIATANSAGNGIITSQCHNSYFKDVIAVNNSDSGILHQSNFCLLESISCFNNGAEGIYLGATGTVAANNKIYNAYVLNNGIAAGATSNSGITIDIGATGNKFYNTQVLYNSGGSGAVSGGIAYAGSGGYDTLFYGLTTLGNKANGVLTAFKFSQTTTALQGNTFVYNWTSNETNKATGWLGYNGTRLFSTNDQGNSNSHFMYTDNGSIEGTATSARSPGICWIMNVGNATGTGTYFRGEQYPLTHNIKSVLCTANTPTTASLWVRRTNDTVTGKFVINGLQIGGIDSDINVYTTSASLTDWERLNIAFTPTQTGFVEFEMQTFATNYYATTAPTGILVWDDFDVTPSTAIAATSGDYAFTAQGVVVSTPIVTTATATEKSFVFC